MKYLILMALVLSCSSLPQSSSRKEVRLPLQSGANLVVKEDLGLQRSILVLTLKGLPNQIPYSEQGVMPILGRIFDMGPSHITEEAYRKQLFQKNASISYSYSYRSFQVTVVSPEEHMADAVSLAYQTLVSPKLDDKNLNHVKASVLANTQSSFTSMSKVITYYAFKDFMGFHSSTFDASTSPRLLSQLSATQIRELYKKYFSGIQANAYFAGKMNQEKVAAILNQEWSKYKLPTYQAPTIKVMNVSTLPSSTIKIIHREKVTDHQVLFVYPNSIPRDSREGIASMVMFELFGGGLQGDLGKVLREERGLTYHVSASYGRFLPTWYVYSFAGSQQLKSLLSGIQEVKDTFQGRSLTKAEIAAAKTSLINDYKAENELPVDGLRTEIYFDLFDLNSDYYFNFEKIVSQVSEKDLDSLRKEVLGQKNFYLYLMGDKSVIEPIVKSLFPGVKVEVIDESKI